MIPTHINPLQPPPKGSTFVMEDHIEFLCRTVDWYDMPSLQRYLLNMASWQMSWLDQMTEVRRYNFESWGYLRLFWDLMDDAPAVAAREAYEMWGDLHTHFEITHIKRALNGEEVQLLGDDPCDAANFIDLHPGIEVKDFFVPPVAPDDWGVSE